MHKNIAVIAIKAKCFTLYLLIFINDSFRTRRWTST